jgi:high-affinity nickel permease
LKLISLAIALAVLLFEDLGLLESGCDSSSSFWLWVLREEEDLGFLRLVKSKEYKAVKFEKLWKGGNFERRT